MTSTISTWSSEATARLNVNLLCLGARVIGVELAKDLANAFLKARFTGEERRHRRLKKIAAIEHRALQGNPAKTVGGQRD